MKLLSRKTFYLMDENVKMSQEDLETFPNGCVINSTDIFNKGTPDEPLTKLAKKKGWVIVTKDIRMALRSLIDKVSVIYINDGDRSTTYLEVKVYKRHKYRKMYDYLYRRFGYNQSRL